MVSEKSFTLRFFEVLQHFTISDNLSCLSESLIIALLIKTFHLLLRKMTTRLSRNICRRLEIRILSIQEIIRYWNVLSLQKTKKLLNYCFVLVLVSEKRPKMDRNSIFRSKHTIFVWFSTVAPCMFVSNGVQRENSSRDGCKSNAKR